MHPRLAEEWHEVTSLYPDASHALDPERVQVALPVPSGLYNWTQTPVSILIPAGYRAVGPDGFLVPVGLHLVAGGLPASDAAGLGMEGWLLLSFHFIDDSGQSTWRATADPSHGDNLTGYIEAVRAFLGNACN
jgi:hypothetical protein